ncbi:MAG: MFS transporter [Trebonia sp.]|jgi:EmrB/QacA subfamily drug resistance transporter
MTTTSDDTVAAEAARLTTRLRLILIVVILADVLDLMDSTITNIAAPTIARDIGGGESLIKWLGASYALAMGVLLVVGARLGDRYGRRRIFLLGIAGFTLASLAAGLSVDPVMLIAARLVQGGFGALLIPQGIGLLIASFNREQMRGAFSVFGPVMGASAILGPILAGFIISANIGGLTWRPIFLINIILGTAGFIAALRVLPADEPAERVLIDALGASLLGASMFGLIYGLIEGSTDGWTALPIGFLAAGAALLAAFWVRQRMAADPLILPSLLANRGFTAGLLLGLAFFAALNGLAYVISLFFQTGLGMTARAASIALSPFMIGIIVASFVCRPLLGKLGRTMVLIGLVLTLAGAAGVWATVRSEGTQVSLWTLAPSILVLGIGAGACFTSLFDVAIGDVAPAEAGSASGSLSAVQQLASAIGSAVVTTVYFSQRSEHGAGHAMTVTVAVVAAIAALGLGIVWLMPKAAPAEEH